MRLILTEKPSVAAEFARVLGAQRHQGCYKTPDTIITYCVGHLVRLCNPDEYNPTYKEWQLETLPIIPLHYRYAEVPDQQKQLTIIKTLIAQLKKTPYSIVIATDAGREGELIARETLQWCGKTDLVNVFRFWTSQALTSEVIEHTLANLKSDDQFTALYESAYHRQLSDWLVGMNFTRFFSVKLGTLFSFGRVQVPVLSAVVSRSNAVDSFKPKPFYNFRVTLSKSNSTFSAFYVQNASIRFEDRAILEPILTQIQTLRPKAKILKVHSTRFNLPPSSTTLQPCSKTPTSSLDTKPFKLPTSPRLFMNSTRSSPILEPHPAFSPGQTTNSFAIPLPTLIFITPTFFGDTSCPLSTTLTYLTMPNSPDHHALIVLDKLPPTLIEEERNVATLILKNMASLLLSPFIYDLQTLEIDICSLTYQAKGTHVLTPGWKQLYEQAAVIDDEEEDPPKEDENENPKNPLPPITEGEVLDVFSEDIIEKSTRPPAQLTESTPYSE